MSEKTHWGVVAILLIAAVISALQIGKAAIALPILQRELMLTLGLAAWIVGAYGMLGAFAGLPAGIVASLFTARRTTLWGLAGAGVGSLLGAFAESGAWMIASRALEGCGYLAATLAIPRLLRAVAAPADQNVVFPLFGAHLPTGSLLMMLAGPHLLAFGWQALWWVNGVLVLLCAIAVARLRLDEPPPAGNPMQTLGPNVRIALGSSGPILLALAFGTYTFQYMAMAGLLPTLLVDRLGLSIAAAGTISAIAVAANAAGNMSAGLLLRMGVPTWAIVAGAFAFVGMAGFGIFSATMSVAAVAALAAASLAMTGLIPGSIHAAAPGFAATSALLAIVLGLMNQATNLGNLFGPAITAAVIERHGWSGASWVFLGVGIAGLVWALLLRRAMARKA